MSNELTINFDSDNLNLSWPDIAGAINYTLVIYGPANTTETTPLILTPKDGVDGILLVSLDQIKWIKKIYELTLGRYMAVVKAFGDFKSGYINNMVYFELSSNNIVQMVLAEGSRKDQKDPGVIKTDEINGLLKQAEPEENPNSKPEVPAKPEVVRISLPPKQPSAPTIKLPGSTPVEPLEQKTGSGLSEEERKRLEGTLEKMMVKPQPTKTPQAPPIPAPQPKVEPIAVPPPNQTEPVVPESVPELEGEGPLKPRPLHELENNDLRHLLLKERNECRQKEHEDRLNQALQDPEQSKLGQLPAYSPEVVPNDSELKQEEAEEKKPVQPQATVARQQVKKTMPPKKQQTPPPPQSEQEDQDDAQQPPPPPTKSQNVQVGDNGRNWSLGPAWFGAIIATVIFIIVALIAWNMFQYAWIMKGVATPPPAPTYNQPTSDSAPTPTKNSAITSEKTSHEVISHAGVEPTDEEVAKIEARTRAEQRRILLGDKDVQPKPQPTTPQKKSVTNTNTTIINGNIYNNNGGTMNFGNTNSQSSLSSPTSSSSHEWKTTRGAVVSTTTAPQQQVVHTPYMSSDVYDLREWYCSPSLMIGQICYRDGNGWFWMRRDSEN